MDTNSVPPAVRWAIARWPQDAERGAVSVFCARHQISRSVFYKIREQARRQGPVAALEPGSRAPCSRRTRADPRAVQAALAIRQDLATGGFDHGPLSVIDRMRRAGLKAPSRATLARYFQDAGIVVPEPRKRPRSAQRRFVYPAPNCMWQIDAFDWSLADASPGVVFQIIDDHSRMALASLAARGETSSAAIEVVSTAMDRWGIPVKFLSDNGAAFNPTRRGHTGQLVEFLRSRGVEPVTGRPGRPTTQGKNERFHQTLLRYLHKQPPARSLEQLQEQIDTFDQYYNHERGHQAHRQADHRMLTPWDAWQATAPADPPDLPGPDRLPPAPAPVLRPPGPQGWVPPAVTTTVGQAGRATGHGTEFHIGARHAGTSVTITYTTTTVTITQIQTGQRLRRYARPTPTTAYAGPRTHPAPPEDETG